MFSKLNSAKRLIFPIRNLHSIVSCPLPPRLEPGIEPAGRSSHEITLPVKISTQTVSDGQQKKLVGVFFSWTNHCGENWFPPLETIQGLMLFVICFASILIFYSARKCCSGLFIAFPKNCHPPESWTLRLYSLLRPAFFFRTEITMQPKFVVVVGGVCSSLGKGAARSWQTGFSILIDASYFNLLKLTAINSIFHSWFWLGLVGRIPPRLFCCVYKCSLSDIITTQDLLKN